MALPRKLLPPEEAASRPAEELVAEEGHMEQNGEKKQLKKPQQDRTQQARMEQDSGAHEVEPPPSPGRPVC